MDKPIVTDQQNCGNILAGVGPFAIERGLVDARDGTTDVRIFMENTSQVATATIDTPAGRVSYEGIARIDGVPGTAAPVPIVFEDTAGSTCGALLPTGNPVDDIDGIAVTMIDNGMPCVVMRAADLGIAGDEEPKHLEANEALRQKLEAIRLKTGPMMNLGDVAEKSVPKMTYGLDAAAWRRHLDAHLHSAPLPLVHRRAGRRQRGYRLSPTGQPCGGAGDDSGWCRENLVDRTSDRRNVDRREDGRLPGEKRCSAQDRA